MYANLADEQILLYYNVSKSGFVAFSLLFACLMPSATHPKALVGERDGAFEGAEAAARAAAPRQIRTGDQNQN